MREYAVIFGKTATGWSAYVPDLPGLVATGPTLEAVEQLMQEGLDYHLESMLEDGDPIPDPLTRVRTLRTDIVETFAQRLAKSA